MTQTVSEFSYTDPETMAIGMHATEVSGGHWRISARRNGAQAWLDLPGRSAAALAHLLLGDERLVEQVATVEQVARIEYTRGDLQIVVEGGAADDPIELARALRVAIEGGELTERELLDRMAEILDVPAGMVADELLDLLRVAKETILEQDQKIGQMRTEAETARELVERIARERDGRPTRLDLQQATTDANRFKAQRDKAETAAAQAEAGMTELRHALRAVALIDMSTQAPGEIARRIVALGEQINHLTGKLSDEGRLHDGQIMQGMREQVEQLQERYADATRRGTELQNALQVEQRRVKQLIDERETAGGRVARLRGALQAVHAATSVPTDQPGAILQRVAETAAEALRDAQ